MFQPGDAHLKERLVVIQCRLGSRRLPGKALYPLAGRPMLSFLLRRLKSGLPQKDYALVLATTRKREDDVIAQWGREEGVNVVRGEGEDVLARYLRCLERFPAATVVRVTADNPLTCPKMLIQAADLLIERSADYVWPQNLPCGAAVDVFAAGVIRRLSREAVEAEEREHINAFILKNPDQFLILKPKVNGGLARPELRVSVDTLADWRRIEAILSLEDQEPWRMDLGEAIERLDRLALC